MAYREDRLPHGKTFVTYIKQNCKKKKIDKINFAIDIFVLL